MLLDLMQRLQRPLLLPQQNLYDDLMQPDVNDDLDDYDVLQQQQRLLPQPYDANDEMVMDKMIHVYAADADDHKVIND